MISTNALLGTRPPCTSVEKEQALELPTELPLQPEAVSETNNRPRSNRDALLMMFLLAFFAILQALLPLASALRIGPDEDYEMAKATLCLKGHELYTGVWNDQPPLHTFIAVQLLKHASPSILGPRLISVAAAVLLLISLFSIARRVSGAWAALMAAALLVASPGFLELSSSCMVEVPTVAPAVAALAALLLWPERSRIPKELVASVLFGISFQVKLITLYLLPLAGIALWLRLPPEFGRIKGALLKFSLLCGVSAAVFVAINQLVDGGSLLLQFHQSWQAHFASTQSFEYGSPADRPFDWRILLRNWDLAIPACIGLIAVFRSFLRPSDAPKWRDGEALTCRGPESHHSSAEPFTLHQPSNPPIHFFPFLWFGWSLLVFGAHKPWWPCYYLHNAVPLCWCAAIGIDALRKRALPKKNRGWRVALAIYVLCALPWLAARLYLEISSIRNSPRIPDSLVLKELQRAKPFADWLYTEEPIYSFHANIPMPPQLAVVALKRFWSGDMTNQRLASELWSLRPSIMLLGNDGGQRPYEDLLAAHYRLVFVDQQHRLFLRKDVASRAGT